MDLITTHINADFDAQSSMVAVSKLYPGARFLLPSSQEKDVRKFLSLIKDNKLVGIVTRTDVLKKVHSSFFSSRETKRKGADNYSEKMKRSLPPKLMQLVLLMGKLADTHGMNAFLVGGFTRDLIIGRKNYDLDVVVEGSAISFGKLLADKIGGSLVVHRKFGTATLVKEWPKWLGKPLHADNKFKIDIATARRDIYEKPAALPTVEFSSLREDLYRRDFTVNAMAIAINKNDFGSFMDFFGGIDDLKKKTIRVLHDKSFIDDPTRIFRAVRFEQRFGFKIEEHTEYLIKNAIKQDMFHHTENQRIREELVLMLKEHAPERSIFRMRQLHELRFIHPELVLKKNVKRDFDALKKAVKWYESTALKNSVLDVWLMNFMIMLDCLNVAEVQEVLAKFVFTRSEGKRIMAYKAKGDVVMRKLASPARLAPSAIVESLKPISHEGILCLLARTRSGKAAGRIKKFLTCYRGVTSSITGEDIQRAGLKPGPEFSAILKDILARKLDGQLVTRKDELGYLRRLVKGMTK